jgi:hypothetical protein
MADRDLGISSTLLPPVSVAHEFVVNYKDNGLEDTGRMEVDKAAQLLLASEPIKTALQLATVGIKTTATYAALALLAPTAGATAYVRGPDPGTHTDPVTGEPDVPNEGEYSGSEVPLGWRRIGDIVDIDAEIALKQDIYGAPVLHGATEDGDYPSAVANIVIMPYDRLSEPSLLDAIFVKAREADDVVLKLMEQDAGTNNAVRIGDDITVAMPGAGWWEIDVSGLGIVGGKDQWLGWYGPDVLSCKIETPAFGPGWTYSPIDPGGNVSTVPLAAANKETRLGFGARWLPIVRPAITQEIAAAKEPVSAAGTQIIGRPVLDPSAVNIAQSLNFTFMQMAVAEHDAPLKPFRVRTTGAGPMFLKFEDVNINQIGNDIVLVAPSAGLHEFDLSHIIQPAGSRLALYGYPIICHRVTTPADGSGFTNIGTGNVRGTDGVMAALATTVQVQWGADLKFDRIAAIDSTTADILAETVTNATLAVDGLEVTPSVQIVREGEPFTFPGEPIALSAPPAGTSRYDLVVFNAKDNDFEIVEGTADAKNSQHASCMPVPANSWQIELFRVRVADGVAEAEAVPRWRVFDGIDVRVESENEKGIERSRKCLAPIHKRMRDGQTLHIAFFGDSQTAHSNAQPLDPAVPNGPNRDRATAPLTDPLHYFRDGYSEAICDAIALYTALQNGWADDGEGAVHTREGWHWGIAKAIMDELGYVLTGGTPLLKVDNYSRAGWSTANAFEADGVTPTAWLAAALASGAHFLVVPHGQNELNDPLSEARFVRIAQLAQAQGMTVMFIGAPLDGDTSVSGWQFTQRAMERAARFTGSGYVPTVHLYDPRFQGVGLAKADYCAANKFGVRNHAGFEEYALITSLARRIVLP